MNLFRWLHKRYLSSCRTRRTRCSRTARPPRPRLALEILETRLAPAVTASVAGSTLTVTLGANADSATLTGTTTAGDSIQVAGTGFATTTFGPALTSIVVQDSGGHTGQAVTLTNAGTNQIILTGAVSISGIESVTLNAANSMSVGSFSESGATTLMSLGTTVGTTGAQTYNDAVTLTGTVFATSAGGAVSFGSTINGAQFLEVSCAAAPSFGGQIGTAATPLNWLQVQTETSLTWNRTVYSSICFLTAGDAGGSGHNLTFAGSPTINSNAQIYQAGTGTGNCFVSFSGASFRDTPGTGGIGGFTIQQDTNVNDSTLPTPLQFGGAGPGSYSLHSLNGSVTLSLTSTAANLAGNELYLAAATTATINIPLTAQPLFSLDVTAPSGIFLNAAITTDVTQAYHNNVVLGTDVVLTDNRTAITFDSTITGAHALTVNSATTPTFGGQVGTVATPLTALLVQTAAALNLNQPVFATTAEFDSGTSGGAGNNLTFTAGTTINSTSQTYSAGNGTGSSSVNLIGANFKNTAGTGTPTNFTFRQDAGIADAALPSASQFAGSALPTNYTIDSRNGSVALTIAGTAAKIKGTNLTLAADTTLTLGVPLTGTNSLASLVATGTTGIGLNADIQTTAGQTYNGNVTLGGNRNLTAGSGGTVKFNGNLTLGPTAATAIDTLNVTGNFALNAGGTSTLTTTFGGTGTGQFGHVVANNSANLGGGTVAVNYSSFSPSSGNSFDVVGSGTGISNPFSNAPAPGPDNLGGFNYNVTYNGGGTGRDFVLSEVNHAPSGTNKTVTTLEDTAYTFSTADFGFSDPNDTPPNTLLAVKITTLPGAGTLRDNGVAVTAGQFIPVADITGNKLAYTPAANANGTPYTSFTFQVQDNGGTANGGVDLDPTPATMTFNVTSVNDAPSGANKTVTTLEDTPYSFAVGDFGFSDPNDSPANTLLAVKITTLPGGGSLTDNGVGISVGQFVPVADISGGKLSFTPAPNANGNNYASFTFQVQDNGGTSNGGVDLDPTARTLTINVTSVNDAPSGADRTVTPLEDSPYTFAPSEFGFSDPSDTPANTLLAVKITTLPAAGTLKDNGVAVTAGQFVPVADISGGKLVFTPAANANGTPYTSFTFQVQDNGGTANGGVDLAPTASTFTFNVTAVNDAPSGTNKTVTTLEDTVYAFSTADFGFSDPNDSPANTLLAVKITTLPAAGTLKDNGVAVTGGQFVPVADITGGKLVFTPAANGNGSPYTSFTFQVQDNGFTTNGGVDLDPTARTMTLNVTAVNDAPSGANKAVTTLEDTPYTFAVGDFGFSDPNDSPPNTLLAVKIATLPAAGTLRDNGVAVTVGQFIPVADITGNKLVFTPAANGNGSPYTSFTFQVQDNGGTANGGVDLDPTARTMTMNVTSVNDAPSGTNKTVTTLEDTAYTFSTADFGFSDPNDTPADTLLAVKIASLPAAGTLRDNGVAVTVGQFVPVADITGSKLSFTPAANANGSPYASFTFQVQDNGGTANGGVDLDPSAATLTINVTGVNDAPNGTNKTVTTLEETSYTFSTADFGFTDPNDTPANSLLAVKITTLPGAGTLKDNGVAITVGQFVPVADLTGNKLVFTPAANGNGTPYASFTFQVQDNGGTANGGVDLDPTAATMTINVTSVNDAPSGTNKTVTTLEDTAYTFTTADFGFTDPNDSPANTLLAVKIATLPGAGSLTDNGVAVTVGQFVPVADITGSKLKFTPAANANGSPYASFTFQVQDNGGTTNGGVDLDPTPATMTFNVTAVNDAPSGTSKTVTTLEDTAYTFTVADFGFSDPNDSPANTLLAVKIATLPGAGTLKDNGVAVTVGQFIPVADITGGKLVFTPAANGNGNPYASFTFRVQDNGGTLNGGVDLDPTARTMTLSVTAVNDAPAGTSKTVTTLEDTPYTFTTADFGFTDPNDSPANTLLAVKITTLPGTGTLKDNGVAVTVGQFVPVADISGNKLVFTPAANANGGPYGSFTFQVQDNGGTANGGVNLDPTARTLTINVTSVNDAPSGTSKTVTTLEDTAYTFTTADFGFTDPNDTPANTLLAVKIATLPGAGSLTDNGVAVTVGQFVPVADITGSKLKFTPAANANGSPYASFTFQVQDNGGTTNGGVDLDPTAATMTFNVTAVNDAPNGTNQTVTTLEDTAYTFTTADFGFSDPNDSPANTLFAVKIATLPAAGTLKDNGVAITVGQFIPVTDITGNKLVFTPAANGNGSPYTSFTFQVQDNGGTANGGSNLDPTAATMTVNVTSVNDAPAGANKTVSTFENTPYTFSTADFGFSDPNDTPANTLLAVKITTLPGAGSLTDNGVAVTAGQFIPVADITGNKLVFTPAANVNGSPYATFTFQVQDNGGTTNGGVDLDPTPRTLTVNVRSVNNAPTGASKTVTTLEDTPYTFSTADFGFSDPNDSPPDSLLAVKITTLPGAGSLKDNGVAVTAGQFVPVADITGGKLLFTPAANANGTGYASFTFQVQDNGGTANGGVDLDPTARTMTVNVTAVNDAPSGTNQTVTTLEDTPYTFSTADFGFTDSNDSPANTLLAVKMSTLPGAGTLKDNGVALTVGQFIPVADITGNELVFTPAANVNGSPYTSFTFQVQDNGGIANGGVDLDPTPRTLTVNVTPVNDAPAGANKTVATYENTAYTFTTADFGFSDPNDSPANALLAVEITTLPGAGTLADNGVEVTAGQFIPVADITGGNLIFTPAANVNDSPYASFTFQVQDNGGTANGGTDLDPTPRTLTINVRTINHAPSGASNTVTALEDTAYAFTTADFGFSDPNDSPADSFLAVKITTLTGAGTFTDNGVAVTTGQFVPVTDITAGKLIFTPAANANGTGYTDFTFQVQDNGGTTNGGVDLDPTARSMTIDVTAVNDAPSGANQTVTTLEDTAYTFTTVDFGFSDPNDSPANTLLAIKITTLPAVGTITDNGVAVLVGQFIPVADISGGKLAFTPAANGNGTGYTSFTFQVQDNGGTANGGVDLDPTARTLTVNITAVNDAPSGTNETVTTLEDTAYTFSTADFGFSDPNDTPPNTLLAVKITTLPGSGTLTDNGVAVSAGQFIPVADLTGGLLVFTPAANANGAGYAHFTFQVQDNGSTANGGVDLDPTPRTLTVNVTGVNDAPAGASHTVATYENILYTFTKTDFGFSDPHDSPANTLLAVEITTLPGAGSLTDNGVAVTAGQFIPVADIIGGKLAFTPAADTNGSPYASFTFQVQDNGGTANGGADLDPTPRTLTVNVRTINHAPSGTSNTVTTLEDTPYTFSTADFGFSDPNDSPPDSFLAVEITTLPGAGSLTDNSVAVSAGQFVSVADVTGGQLVFTPAANANGMAYTSFTFQVQDNGGTANGGVDLDPTPRTLTVNVTALNDAPAGTSNTVTTFEDTAYTFGTADFGFTDPNDSPANALLAVEITTLPSAGSLADNGVAVTAGQFIPVADLTGGLLVFTPAANANGTNYASFTFQVQDDGGTANGGNDLDPTPRTLTINVTSVNNAPAGASNTVTTLEDTPYSFSAADFGFTDPNDSPANALLAVKITALPSAGSLTDNGVAVTAGQFIPVADLTGGNLLFTPTANANGTNYASFTFQVQDDGGTANGGVDLDPTPRTLTINVTSVNDVPTGADNAVTILEDTTYTFGTADFGFTDPNDSPPNTLLAVQITTLPSAGILTDNGVAVSAGQLVPVADITGNRFVFTPAANGNGSPYASFTFQVQDNGGTANGGNDLDPTPQTFTVNVNPVNSAPAGASNTATTMENTPYTFTTADFGFSDPSDSPANTLLAVEITTLPNAGSLTDNGAAVKAGQLVPVADLTGNKLVFTPAADTAGTAYASFTFQVQDNGSTANGGIDLDPTPRTLTFNVTSDSVPLPPPPAQAAVHLFATGAGVGSTPEVKVYDAGSGLLKLDFFAYGPSVTGGVRVAVADVNGDGVPDIITGPGPGAAPEVKVFDGRDGSQLYWFFGFEPSFTGGVYVAAGDVNGDGYADIVVGKDSGGLPEVKVFGGGTQSGRQLYWFVAYDAGYRGGVTVAAGDSNGDGYADIITGTAFGTSHVKVFGGGVLNGQQLRSFLAFNPLYIGGVYVAAGDMNGDGKADLIVGSGGDLLGNGPQVRVFSGAGAAELQSVVPFNAAVTGEARVAAVDFNGDGKADLVIGAGPLGGPHVRVLDAVTLAGLDSFFAFVPELHGGVFVGGG